MATQTRSEILDDHGIVLDVDETLDEQCARLAAVGADDETIAAYRVTDDSAPHDDESYWNMTFGPTQTRELVLADAEAQSLTPQDYARDSIRVANEQGAGLDVHEAYRSLCHQLRIDE